MFRSVLILAGLVACGCTQGADSADQSPETNRTSGPGDSASQPSAEADHAALARWNKFVKRYDPYRKTDVPDLRTRKSGIDWPAFLGPNHDSKSPETGILTKWPPEGPRIVWQKRVGASFDIPTTSKGRLFMFDRTGDQERLTAMNSETGKELWQVDYPTDYEDMYGYGNGPRCSPIVDDDRVYTHGAEGMLFCRRVTDGKPIWNIDTHAAFGVQQNFFGVGSTPLVEGDLLIVQIGGSPADSPGIQSGRVESNGSGIVAFDKFSGEIKYVITNELASYSSPVPATIGGRRWCFVFARGGLVGFEPTSGQVNFQYPWRSRILESVNAANPIVVDDRVFITETYGPGSSLLRVRDGGYEVVWTDADRGRNKSMKAHWNTPIHVDGYVYGCSGRNPPDGELRCIELETGKVMWKQGGMARSSLLYVDGHFVCVAEYGELLLVKATPEKFDLVAGVLLRGEASAEVDPALGPPRLLNYPAWAAPILSHGLLYVRGRARLACLELIPEG